MIRPRRGRCVELYGPDPTFDQFYDAMRLPLEQRSGASDLAPLRLTPAAADVPAGAQANYRGRAGNSLAILTVEALPSPSGQTYAAWVRHADHWTMLGTFAPQRDGTSRQVLLRGGRSVSDVRRPAHRRKRRLGHTARSRRNHPRTVGRRVHESRFSGHPHLELTTGQLRPRRYVPATNL